MDRRCDDWNVGLPIQLVIMTPWTKLLAIKKYQGSENVPEPLVPAARRPASPSPSLTTRLPEHEFFRGQWGQPGPDHDDGGEDGGGRGLLALTVPGSLPHIGGIVKLLSSSSKSCHSGSCRGPAGANNTTLEFVKTSSNQTVKQLQTTVKQLTWKLCRRASGRAGQLMWHRRGASTIASTFWNHVLPGSTIIWFELFAGTPLTTNLHVLRSPKRKKSSKCSRMCMQNMQYRFDFVMLYLSCYLRFSDVENSFGSHRCVKSGAGAEMAMMIVATSGITWYLTTPPSLAPQS